MNYSRMTKLEGKPDTYRGDIPLRNPMISPCGERANG